MIVAVHQPQYLPWLGYFHKIAACDAFVLLDRVQYKKREFQNRNRIKTARGPEWLTVPVLQRGRYTQPLGEVEIDPAAPWARSHLDRIRLAYRGAPHFGELFPDLEKILGAGYTRLSDLSTALVRLHLERFGIATPLLLESDLAAEHGDFGLSTRRIVGICKALGADVYLSGAGGRDYMDLDLCAREGLCVTFQSFPHPAYRQLHGAFTPFLCAVDLLMNEGPRARGILLGGERA